MLIELDLEETSYDDEIYSKNDWTSAKHYSLN